MLTDLEIDLLLEAIGSTTMWQFAQDITYYAMALFGGYDMQTATILTAVGAIIGSMLNFGVGYAASIAQNYGTTVSPEKYAFWQGRFNWLIAFIGLFSWIHLVGVLLAAAGFLRVKWWRALLAVSIGQGIYSVYLLKALSVAAAA